MLQATHPFQLVAGLIVWTVWFVVLYAGLSVGCAVAPPAAEQGVLNWINLSLAAISLATMPLLAGAAKRAPWALLALLFTLMHTGFLGAVLTFAESPLYGEARSLADQQLAGLIMWVVGSVP